MNTLISIGLPKEIRQYRLHLQANSLHEVKRLLEGQGLFPCYCYQGNDEVRELELIFSRRAPALEALSCLQKAGIIATYSKNKWVI